ncbi:arginase-1-like isoform X2 [Octopus vulgaris]|uniref:Arginase n=1 Tax=Octopus vulgaris TaxID=6645 RepID=A0AA36FCV6_OCTVU|nr:arginase-1-like isoform X2 [Octopus vulgaris]
MKPLSVIGSPINIGQPKPGVIKGPDAMRKHGLIEKLKERVEEVYDLGNLTFPDVGHDPPIKNMKNPKAVATYNKILSDKVSEERRKGHNVVVLGGDHSLGIGSVHGQIEAEKEKPVLLWIDAHSDINSPKTSPSGNAHGMPVAYLIEEMRNQLPEIEQFNWVHHSINAKDVVYIGLRDIDVGEIRTMKNLGVKFFSMQEVEEYGIAKVVKLALDLVDITSRRFDIERSVIHCRSHIRNRSNDCAGCG